MIDVAVCRSEFEMLEHLFCRCTCSYIIYPSGYISVFTPVVWHIEIKCVLLNLQVIFALQAVRIFYKHDYFGLIKVKVTFYWSAGKPTYWCLKSRGRPIGNTPTTK